MAKNLISVIERGYELGLPDAEWLNALVVRSAATMTADGRAIGCAFEATSAGDVSLGQFVDFEVGIDWSFAKSGLSLDAMRLAHADMGLMTLREALVPLGESSGVDEYLRRLRWKDVWGLVITDGHSRGISLSFPVDRQRSPTRRQRIHWAKVREHLSSALRLRNRLQRAGGDVMSLVDAVFTPEGRAIHMRLEGELQDARAELAQAVRDVDGARTRRGADASLTLWKNLVLGKWSIVESTDRDGKRLYLVFENSVASARLFALSSCERRVVAYASEGRLNKQIGYELGLSPATVATHLESAMLKLGLSRRTQIAALFGRRSSGGNEDAFAALTRTERAVMDLVVRGHTNANIAEIRGRSVRTVANQVARILRATGTSSRTELAAKAARLRGE